MSEDFKNNILKTGTSIVGIVCKDGVVMAADRQVSAGTIVMSKREQKVFQVNNYLVAAGCGVAGDVQRVPKFLSAELKLQELKSKSRPTVKQAANLLNNISYNGIRQPSVIPQQAGFLLGGFNVDGSIELYSVEPAGSLIRVEDYDANFGSGMPFILGYLERNWKKNLTVEEGINLAIESIKTSTQRDMGSGFGIDVIIIKKDKIEHIVKERIEPNYIEEK
jgi:proteasome beta subunit